MLNKRANTFKKTLEMTDNFFNEFENEQLKKFKDSFEYILCSADRKQMFEAMQKYELSNAPSDLECASRKNKELLKHAKDLADLAVGRLSKNKQKK